MIFSVFPPNKRREKKIIDDVITFPDDVMISDDVIVIENIGNIKTMQTSCILGNVLLSALHFKPSKTHY